jgi:hypothetical protein
MDTSAFEELAQAYTNKRRRETISKINRIIGDRKRHLIGMKSHEDACIALHALEKRFPDVPFEVIDIITFYTVRVAGNEDFPFKELAAWIQGYMDGREAAREV